MLCRLCSKNSRLRLIKATDHSHYRWESEAHALSKSSSLRSHSLSLWVIVAAFYLLHWKQLGCSVLCPGICWRCSCCCCCGFCCCFAWIVSELIDCFCPTVTKFAGVESSNKLLLLLFLCCGCFNCFFFMLLLFMFCFMRINHICFCFWFVHLLQILSGNVNKWKT